MPPVKSKRRAKTAKNPRKRMMLPAGIKKGLGWGLPLGTGALLIGGAAWLVMSGAGARALTAAENAALAWSADAGLRVENVLVTGRDRVSKRSVERALATRPGMPILGFDPAASKARLETHVWIKTAIVERRLPDTLYIRIIERQPLALWQKAGKLALIGADGAVITRWKLNRFHALPLVVGSGAPKHAARIIRTLRAYPKINARVQAISRIAKRRWDLKFKNGVVARLPEKDAAAALATLNRLIQSERILDRDVVAIDLRLKDRLVVRTTGAAKNTGNKPPRRGARRRGAASEDT